MVKIKHIFQVPFTGKTPNGDGFTSQAWYDKRASLFERFTIPSLKNQTRKDFLLWVTFRPEELFNKTTKKIARVLSESKIDNIMSFNGTMFTEDRAVWHNVDLKERLAVCLSEVKKMVGDATHIYETNLDSDDMVHRDFSKTVQERKYKKHGALYMGKGFAYNTQGRVADWNNPTSNQNYTIMFPATEYFDPEKRLKYLKGFKSHEEIPELFKAERLPDGMYCTVIHGDNISTVWQHPFREKEYVYEDEQRAILKEFYAN
jgi:hypothetical protein|tara:strand:- start:3630 stop:4409 length:780 start_codon:yes stop_codon:yes gene_type:complete